MIRAVLCLALAALAACGPAPSPAPPPSNRADPAEPAPPPPPTTTTRTTDGRCEPMPREGAPCAAGDSWCVISWGEPGGSSGALWCRGGRWEYETESNL